MKKVTIFASMIVALALFSCEDESATITPIQAEQYSTISGDTLASPLYGPGDEHDDDEEDEDIPNPPPNN